MYIFGNALLNELGFGYAPFKWSDVEVSEGEMSLANENTKLFCTRPSGKAEENATDPTIFELWGL